MTEPKTFRDSLVAANRDTNGSLVRAIKLYKAINAELPEQKRVSGYHMEALAVEAARGFQGPFTPRHMLQRLLTVGAERVLHPMNDATGQSRHIDEELGEANSIERRVRSQAMQGIKRRLDAANSVSEWRAVFGE